MLLMRHAAILVTGISGVGKSTALTELARRGFTTVDTDSGPWIHVVDGEPLWRQPMIDALLDRPPTHHCSFKALSPTRVVSTAVPTQSCS